jgi:alpha-glucosidase
MKRFIVLFFLLIAAIAHNAQVTFVITSLPDYTPPEDQIYLAGDINGWNPGDVNNVLQKNDEGLWEITTDTFPDGLTIAFKFTRGDWLTVEKGENGEEIADRNFTFGNGETVEITIANWADFGGGGESTAAWNVSVMDESFYMPQLDRNRRIWIYLPPDYNETDVSYPVIYMHDGQNLFDELTSFAGEWEVDETLNQLYDDGYKVPLVVGIDNGGEYRIDELTPWNNPAYGGGQGDEYLAFIVETLKPYMDANYRTLSDRENTALVGSSLGGLISTYGALKYQDVFSKSGPFSPAYWINSDSIWGFVAENGRDENIRFYQNVGETEGDTYIDMMYDMEDSLKNVGFNEVTSKVIPGGGHNEQTWRNDFAEAYLWLFAAWAMDIQEIDGVHPLVIFPNPVVDEIQIQMSEHHAPVNLLVSDTSGKQVIKVNNFKNKSLKVQQLKPGIYIIRLQIGNENYLGKFVKN